MKIEKARQLDDKALIKEVDKVRDSIVKLQSEISMNRIKNYQSLKLSKRYLARLLTIQKEKEIINQTVENNNE